MASDEISIKKKWDTTCDLLNNQLEEEIYLMREVLTSLYQEEIALMEKAFNRFEKILQNRAQLVLHLQKLRRERMTTSCELLKIQNLLGKTEVFPLADERSCQALTQLDQLFALIDRINLQNCRNDALFLQTKELKAIPLKCPFPHPVANKRKISTATNPLDEKKHPT